MLSVKVFAPRVALFSSAGRQQQLPRRAFISTWDRVRSSMWHPMATVEQSLMDMERITSHLLSGSAFPFSRSLLPRMHDDEDDFFKDLEVSSSTNAVSKSSPLPPTDDKDKQQQRRGDVDRDDNHTFSSYTFSSSTLLDADGHRVSTIRRRYEDSTGRLKAVHEREIDGKRLKNIWRRDSADDKGEHHTVCLGSNSEEFETQWKETLFGQAEKQQGKQEHQQLGKHEQKESKKSPEHEDKSALSADHEAAKVAPEKTSAAEGTTAEARAKSRKDAIAEASKRQEEETTPPNYS
ncbi:hypothetical protein PybrP1_006589 [[Pythium] brassicae (nom. inval.)]|nr:hypothetical protein PybrP1_006589 [[Pythium] brassicae (nom. inval.)]